MNRRIPTSVQALAAAAVLAASGVISLASDFGVGKKWLFGLAVAVVVGVVLNGLSKGRGITWAEFAVVILSGAAALLGATALGLSRELDEERDAHTGDRTTDSTEARRYDFVVFQGEYDPDLGGSSNADYAYPRIEPADDAPSPSGASLSIGERVEVTCRVRPNPSEYRTHEWYRLDDGTFMHSGVVKPVPHSGQGTPSSCP